MSAVFGVHCGKTPPAPEVLSRMAKISRFWGPDAGGTVSDAHASLGQALRKTPFLPGLNPQPLRHDASGCVIVTSARLDYTDELATALGLADADRKPLTCHELILRAYLKWDMDCLSRLYGDWSFALWDPRRHRLLLARDPTGNSGLYYHEDQGRLCFASSIKAVLAAIDHIPKLDETHAAKILVQFPEDLSSTFYHGISRLRAGEALVAEPHRTRTFFHWLPEDHQPDIESSPTAIVEEFVSRYRAAVQSRIPPSGRTAILLSGGLDSTSVAALATPILAEQDRTLRGYTHVPAHTASAADPGRIASERDWVEELAARHPSLRPGFLATPDCSPIAAIREGLAIHGEPTGASGNQYWLHELIRRAKQDGADSLLTGQQGNFTVSWTGSCDRRLAGLLVSGRWNEFTNAYRAWSRFSPHLSLTDFLRSQVIRPFFPDALARFKQLYLQPGMPLTDVYPIRPAFARRTGVEELLRGHGVTTTLPYSGQSMDLRRRTYIRINATNAGSVWNELGGHLGLRACDPTADRRLTEYCLRLPNRAYFDHGTHRALIRDAMREHLPAAILHTNQRGRQSADLPERLLRELPSARDALATVRASPLACEILNVAAVEDTLNALQQTGRCELRAAHLHLGRGLATGLFLAAIESDRRETLGLFC